MQMATSAKVRSIIYFEDDLDVAATTKNLITPLLGKNLRFIPFPLQQPPEGTGPYEDRLSVALSDPSYGDVALLVTDRDLSTQAWGGLSEAAVTRVAEKKGWPVACYRQVKPNVEDLVKRTPGDGQIELDPDEEKRAKQIASLAKGFVKLEELVMTALSPSTSKRKTKTNPVSADPGTPGTLLARVLGHPETATHFDSFACGDQRAVAEILSISKKDDAKLDDATKKRLIVALGVWLADLIMQYPGVLLNEVAAASYLDIKPSGFAKPQVREVFQTARYVNLPFCDEANPMWWRHLLDDLVNAESSPSGRGLCSKRGIKGLKYCPCSVDPELHAGYYCMSSKQPLSAENSSGRVSWFPIGADLARLTKKTHRTLAPWIGS